MVKKSSYLSETVAFTTEQCAVANMYTNLKKQGVEKFQYTTQVNGKDQTIEMPISAVLDLYPGLKEIVEKDGFNPQSPEDIRKIFAHESSQSTNKRYEEFMQQQEAQKTAKEATTKASQTSTINAALMQKAHER